MTSGNALDIAAPELDLETGVSRSDREKLAEHLNEALASTVVLHHKTQLYHWNVAGPLFYSVHKLTEEHYNDLAESIDALAERIRAIGFPAQGGLRGIVGSSVLDDADQSVVPTRDMIYNLATDHQGLATRLRDAVKVAEEVDDVFTADLLTARIGAHEDAAWMLQALLAETQES